MKNNKKISVVLLTAVVAIAFSTSCRKDKDASITFNATKGICIVDQGAYDKVNAGISFLDTTSKIMTNNIFFKVNGRGLGDVAQSIGAANGLYYIVVNNSNKIEVVNKTTFQSTAIIQGVNQPRYFLAVNNTKAYVTEWGFSGTGQVDVINLSNNTISKKIPVGNGAENLLMVDNKVYVVNSGGDLYDNTISVINTLTDQVDTTITVGDNPNSLVMDANGKLWVLCGGKWNTNYTVLTNGTLVRINSQTNAIEQTFQLAKPYKSTTNLITDPSKTTLYYCIDGKVYTQNISAANAASTPTLNGNFYGIFIDKGSSYFYAADARGFSGNGWVIRYHLNFTPIDSFQVGVGPSFFYAD